MSASAFAGDAKAPPTATTKTVAPAAAAAPTATPAPAPAAAVEPAAANEDPDAYLDADFPNASQVAVEPPLASSTLGARVVRSDESADTRSDYGRSYEEPSRKSRPKGTSAAKRGPFLVGTGDILLNDHFSMLSAGVSGGMIVGERLRLQLTLANPLVAETQYHNSSVEDPDILLGANVGIALVRRQTFLLSLAADLSTTDSRDFGWNAGISMPLEWVTRGGFRAGIIPAIIQNVGSSNALDCDGVYDYETDSYSCPNGTSGRAKPSTGVHFQAHVGFTFK